MHTDSQYSEPVQFGPREEVDPEFLDSCAAEENRATPPSLPVLGSVRSQLFEGRGEGAPDEDEGGSRAPALSRLRTSALFSKPPIRSDAPTMVRPQIRALPMM